MPITFDWGRDRITANRWAAFFPVYGDTADPGEWNDPVVQQALTPEQERKLNQLGFDDSAYVVVADGQAHIRYGPPSISASGLSPPAKVDTVERVNVRATSIEYEQNDQGYTYAVINGQRPPGYDRPAEDDVVSLEWNVPDGGADSAFDFS